MRAKSGRCVSVTATRERDFMKKIFPVISEAGICVPAYANFYPSKTSGDIEDPSRHNFHNLNSEKKLMESRQVKKITRPCASFRVR